MSKGVVVGIGEALWDVFPDGARIGGAPANFAYHVAQFGLDSCAVSAVGRDKAGDDLGAALREKQLNLFFVRVDFPTGLVRVTLDSQGVPEYEIVEGVAWDNIPFTDELDALAVDCRAVCFGSLAQRSTVSRATIRRFLDALPDEALKVFDINLRQHYYDRTTITESLRHCDILKLNDEEFSVICDMYGYAGSPEVVCRALIAEYGLQCIILTCGATGSYVFGTGECSYIETPRVAVVDTVGAGDAFTAAFVAKLLQGSAMSDAHRVAVAYSAEICTRAGAMG